MVNKQYFNNGDVSDETYYMVDTDTDEPVKLLHISYYRSGHMKTYIPYFKMNGMINGKVCLFSSDGRIMLSEEYRDNKRYGKVIEYKYCEHTDKVKTTVKYYNGEDPMDQEGITKYERINKLKIINNL
jgi:antitoxin component YwqK of YwqJK toxin-antitoxin module